MRSKHTLYPTTDGNIRDRSSSFSSQISHSTDGDDSSLSLHILSDEQLNHLAYEHHQHQSYPNYEPGMHDKPFQQSNNILSESFLY